MFNEELKDAMKELINISFGSATATIADLFDNFATLHVPDIDIVPLDKIDGLITDAFEGHKIYVTTQQFKGPFQGETIFVIAPESAQNILGIICDDEGIEEQQADENDIQQSILEISNILGSSCIGKLAELLNSEVTFAPPAIDYVKHVEIDDKNSYKYIIVIRTLLEFKDVEILGKLFIMFSDEMFVWLEKALEDFMENL